MNARWISVWVGCWCASLQAGIYLKAETSVTAAAWVYFALTAVWLAGLGLGLGRRGPDERQLMAQLWYYSL